MGQTQPRVTRSRRTDLFLQTIGSNAFRQLLGEILARVRLGEPKETKEYVSFEHHNVSGKRECALDEIEYNMPYLAFLMPMGRHPEEGHDVRRCPSVAAEVYLPGEFLCPAE